MADARRLDQRLAPPRLAMVSDSHPNLVGSLASFAMAMAAVVLDPVRDGDGAK